MFWDLRSCVPEGANGPGPITPTHVRDWITLTGDVISREEYQIIRVMDARYREAMKEEMARYMEAVKEEQSQPGEA